MLYDLKDYKYEGIFETQKEAYMQVKLVEMTCKIEYLECTLNDLLNYIKDFKTTIIAEKS